MSKKITYAIWAVSNLSIGYLLSDWGIEIKKIILIAILFAIAQLTFAISKIS